jgi:hypothetical protein
MRCWAKNKISWNCRMKSKTTFNNYRSFRSIINNWNNMWVVITKWLTLVKWLKHFRIFKKSNKKLIWKDFLFSTHQKTTFIKFSVIKIVHWKSHTKTFSQTDNLPKLQAIAWPKFCFNIPSRAASPVCNPRYCPLFILSDTLSSQYVSQIQQSLQLLVSLQNSIS